MARTDGRVEPGQRLGGAISARAWNRMMDAADIVHGDRYSVTGESGGGGLKPYTWAYCKSAAAVDRWSVLQITGLENPPVLDEPDNPQTRFFEDTPVLTGGAMDDYGVAFCVAVEPIAAGKVGRVAVSGVVQCKADQLQYAVGYQLLWRDTQWALIQIGGGIRLGSISSTWAKGGTATVTEQNGNGTALGGTFYATNYFATVTVSSGTKRVACGKCGNTWILLAAEC